MHSHSENQDKGTSGGRREIMLVEIRDARECTPSDKVNLLTFHWLKNIM